VKLAHCVLISAFLATAPAVLDLRAAEPPAVVAKLDAKTAVTDNATTFTLANGIVTACINKRNGDLEAL
jgi:hypothetical protein